jgi:hypothetical protein
MHSVVRDEHMLLMVILATSFYISIASIPLFYPVILVLLLITFSTKKIVIDQALFIVILLFISSISFQFLEPTAKLYQTVIYTVLGYFVYVLISSLRLLDNQIIISNLNKATHVVIVVITIDTVLRFLFPNTEIDYLKINEDLMFYKYKISYLFSDSNVEGLVLLSLFSLRAILAKAQKKQILDLTNVLLIVLLILTLSRSSMISAFIFILILSYKNNVKYILLTMLLGAIGFAFILPSILSSITVDGSGTTKIRELSAVFSFFSEHNLQEIMFGYGVGFGDELTGKYIHGLYPKLLIELGGITSFIYFIIITLFSIRSKMCLLYFIPILISGISFSFYLFAPYHFASLAILTLYAKNEKN